jgi:hypothetical protein
MKITMKKEGKKHPHVGTQHLDINCALGNYRKGLKRNLPLLIHASKLAK